MVANIQTVYDRLGVELHTVSNETQTSPLTQRSGAQKCGTKNNVDVSQQGCNVNKGTAVSPHNNQMRQAKYAQRRIPLMEVTPPQTHRKSGETNKQVTRVAIPSGATCDRSGQRKPPGTLSAADQDADQWQQAGRRKKKKKVAGNSKK